LTVTNTANGKSLSGHEVVNIHADLQKNTEARTGVPFHVTIPGGGGALLDAGRVFFDANGNPNLQRSLRFLIG
jgi:hypothetical protein